MSKQPIHFSPLALAEIKAIAEEYNVEQPALLKVVSDDAERELSSAAMKHLPWFKGQPRHSFHAARIRGAAGTAALELFMVVSPSERTVFSTVESPLSDEYFAARVIEETLLEIKLGNLPV